MEVHTIILRTDEQDNGAYHVILDCEDIGCLGGLYVVNVDRGFEVVPGEMFEGDGITHILLPTESSREVCCECGQSVALGSGRFANRVGEENDVITRIDMGRAYPLGGWVCADCDAITSDD